MPRKTRKKQEQESEVIMCKGEKCKTFSRGPYKACGYDIPLKPAQANKTPCYAPEYLVRLEMLEEREQKLVEKSQREAEQAEQERLRKEYNQRVVDALQAGLSCGLGMMDLASIREAHAQRYASGTVKLVPGGRDLKVESYDPRKKS